MNPLIDKFPTKIKVGNEILDVNSDFRNCLIIILAFEDEELTTYDKYEIMLARLFGKPISYFKNNLEEAINQAIKFLDCNEKYEVTKKRTYSFKKDSKYIYSAINLTQKIDLNTIEYLHWWKFCIFFLDMDPNSTMSNIIYYRNKKNEGKLTPDERKFYLQNYKLFSLEVEEDDETEQEDDDFMKKFNSSKDDI